MASLDSWPVLLLLLGFIGLPNLPPNQPLSGPGGLEYRHRSVLETVYGEGKEQFWIFEPAQPRLAKVPLVLFLHGYSALVPEPYRLWIEHLVRKGNMVLYPRYQAGLFDSSDSMAQAALSSLRTALPLFDGSRHAEADLSKFGVVGHSFGAVIGTWMTAEAFSAQLPQPRFLMVVQPGDFGLIGLNSLSEQIRYAEMPSDTLALILVGDRDSLTGERIAREIYLGISRLPSESKSYVRVRSDAYGEPDLVANHFSPLASEAAPPDALDYYGYWKLLDALVDAAFFGTHRDFCLGGRSEMTYMGKWADGVKVQPLEVVASP